MGIKLRWTDVMTYIPDYFSPVIIYHTFKEIKTSSTFIAGDEFRKTGFNTKSAIKAYCEG